MEALEAAGTNPYPHKFQISTLLPGYLTTYEHLTTGEHVEDARISIAVRTTRHKGQQHLSVPVTL